MPFVGAWAVLVAAAAAALIWGVRSLSDDPAAVPEFWGYVFFVLTPLGIWMLAATWLSHRRRRLIVTTERVVGQKGVFAVKEINTFFPGVDSVQVEQSILGRLFNYGLISIYWGRTEHPRRFFHVCAPRSIAAEIMRSKAAKQPPTAEAG
jgi:uncharacterized membrane protein YdbT with pleckstrin-like domain